MGGDRRCDIIVHGTSQLHACISWSMANEEPTVQVGSLHTVIFDVSRTGICPCCQHIDGIMRESHQISSMRCIV